MTVNDGRKIGDRVSVDHVKYPGIWVIASRGPVNTVLRPEGGVGRGLRVPHDLLIDPGAAPKPKVVAVSAVFFNPGELVRINAGRYAGLWVVIADRGRDRVNLAKLGGDSGRYLRADRGGLVKIDPSEVLK
jgi:hypothetical protein